MGVDLVKSELDQIKSECRKKVSNYALLSGVNGINPIPGVDMGIDAGIYLKMMAEVRSSFGLDNAIEEKLNRYEMFLPLLKKVFDYATKEGLMILIKSMGKKYLGKSVAKYVPIIGQGVAAAASYGMFKYIGNSYVDDCYELAQKIESWEMENRHQKEIRRRKQVLEDVEDLDW